MWSCEKCPATFDKHFVGTCECQRGAGVRGEESALFAVIDLGDAIDGAPLAGSGESSALRDIRAFSRALDDHDSGSPLPLGPPKSFVASSFVGFGLPDTPEKKKAFPTTALAGIAGFAGLLAMGVLVPGGPPGQTQSAAIVGHDDPACEGAPAATLGAEPQNADTAQCQVYDAADVEPASVVALHNVQSDGPAEALLPAETNRGAPVRQSTNTGDRERAHPNAEADDQHAAFRNANTGDGERASQAVDADEGPAARTSTDADEGPSARTSTDADEGPSALQSVDHAYPAVDAVLFTIVPEDPPDSSLPATLTPSQVARSLSAVAPHVRNCVGQAEPGSRLLVDVVVQGATGRPTASDLIGEVSATGRSCVSRALSRAEFPRFRDRQLVVRSFPIVL